MKKLTVLLTAGAVFAATAVGAGLNADHVRKARPQNASRLKGSEKVKAPKGLQLNPVTSLRHKPLWSANKNFFNPVNTVSGEISCAMNPRKTDGTAGKKIYGNVVYEYSWTHTQVSDYRMVSVDLDTKETSTVYSGPNGQYGAVFYQGKYFTCTPQVIYNFIMKETNTIYDAVTWDVETQYDYAPKDFRGIDMTYDRTTGFIYGCFAGTAEEGYVFGRFDPVNCVVTPISVIGQTPWFGIAANKEGELFAIDNTGVLVKVDKEDGQTTIIKDTGLASVYACSATIDPDTGLMYYSPMSGPAASALYTINTADGSVSKVCDLPDGMELVGLYFDTPTADPAAPAEPTGLTVDFEESALSGTVSFTAPSTLFDGSQASGRVDYTILIDGHPGVSGQTEYGKKTDVQISIPKGGSYTIAVYMQNVAGESPKVQTVCYLGPDIPKMPSDVRLTFDASTNLMSLCWTAPEEGMNGTSITPSNVNYTITSYPSGRVVSVAQNATTYEETVSLEKELTDYYYLVVAENHGQLSAPASSNVISLGDIYPPYFESFAKPQSFESYTVIDVAGDGKTWEWHDGAARAQYNSTQPKDDWLITPGVVMKKGLTYRFQYHTGVENNGYIEYMSLWIGESPTVEGMTENLIPQTRQISRWERGGEIVEAYFTPQKDGVYYYGFYVDSPTNAYWIYINDIKIDAGISSLAPDYVGDLKAVPAPDGSLSATVSFTSPVKTVSGEAIDKISQIQIFREGELVKTVNPAPAPGESASFVDYGVKEGDNNYSVIAYNAAGAGKEAQTSVYVGYAEPAELTAVRILPGEDNGHVIMEWDPVEYDVHGLKYQPGMVSYTLRMITNSGRVDFAEGVTDTRVIVKVNEPDGVQVMPMLGVLPVSQWGMGYGVGSYAPAGKPYSLPFVESAPDGEVTTPIGVKDSAGDGNWYTSVDDDAESQDGDNGMFIFEGAEPDEDEEIPDDFVFDSTILFTARIDIPEDAIHPVFRFYYLSIEEDEDTLEAVVSEDMGMTFTSLATATAWVPDMEWEWIPVTVPLDQYKGKSIQVGVRATVVNFGIDFVDNLSVFDQADYDISRVVLHAPSTVMKGETADVTVSFMNTGLNSADNLAVDLIRDGSVVATKDVAVLEPGETGSVEFEVTTSVLDATVMTLSAKVNYTEDQHPADNVTVDASVVLMNPPYPVPTGAKAMTTDNGVDITWVAPDLTSLPTEPSVDDFESHESFQAEDLGGWISVKVDNGSNGGFKDLDLPNIIVGQSKLPFFVFDVEGEEFNKTFEAHSGTKYMATLFNIDGSPLDCWLITPELSGSSQIVTFWARSYTSQYPESFEVLYSDGSTDPEDFVKIEGQAYASVPDVWTPYAVPMPAGARRMAVRCTSEDAFMLMVDDVTMQLEDSPRIDLTLKGYNVYEGDTKLNGELIDETSYLDPVKDGKEHTYVITAVYDLGESAPSESASTQSGIDGISAEGISVYASKGMIHVAGADGQPIVVSALDGKIIRSIASASSEESISADAGVYVVKTGRIAVKITVR